MSLDPGTLGAINTFALAAIVVLLITGMLVAKPAHDFVIRLLAESHGREAALEKDVGRQTDVIDKQTDKIETMSGRIDTLIKTVDDLKAQLNRQHVA